MPRPSKRAERRIDVARALARVLAKVKRVIDAEAAQVSRRARARAREGRSRPRARRRAGQTRRLRRPEPSPHRLGAPEHFRMSATDLEHNRRGEFSPCAGAHAPQYACHVRQGLVLIGDA